MKRQVEIAKKFDHQKSKKLKVSLNKEENNKKPICDKTNKNVKNKAPLEKKTKKKDAVRSVCLKLYETLRKTSCPEDERVKIINKLSALLRGRLSQVILSHDMSRIVQFMLKRGNAENKAFIVKEIMENSSDLARKKYSNHVIKALVKHCSSSVKRQLIKSLVKDTVSLLTSKNSASLVDELYTKYAVATEKAEFKKYIYGDTFRVLVAAPTDLVSLNSKDPDLTNSVMSTTKKNLLKLLQKEWCLQYPLVTSILKDYLSVCPDTDRREFFEILKLHITDLITTNEGCYVALNILWNSTAKEKKAIIKQLQQDFLKVAVTKSGSFFILSLFDSVDDTVFIKKAIISKMNENLIELMNSNYGRRIIVYIFLHREATSFFTPEELKILEEADHSEHIKKTSKQRLSEIRTYSMTNILISIRDNPNAWILNGPSAIVTVAVFQNATDSELDVNKETLAAFDSISKYILTSNIKIKEEGSSEETNLIESKFVHNLMKKLIKNDKIRHSKDLSLFSSCLVAQLNEEVINSWLEVNRGCFCLVWLLELSIDSITIPISKYLQNKNIKHLLQKQTSVGGKLLREKISTVTK